MWACTGALSMVSVEGTWVTNSWLYDGITSLSLWAAKTVRKNPTVADGLIEDALRKFLCNSEGAGLAQAESCSNILVKSHSLGIHRSPSDRVSCSLAHPQKFGNASSWGLSPGAPFQGFTFPHTCHYYLRFCFRDFPWAFLLGSSLYFLT